MNEVILFSGSSHQEMAKKISDKLEIKLGRITRTRFANNETMIKLLDSVRGADVYIVQTSHGDVNDSLMELLIMIHTCKIASASSITAIMPHFPYARQDKLVKTGRGPITSKLVANLLSTAGADAIITMELHAAQIQGFFDIPTENLSSLTEVVPWIHNNIDDLTNLVVVSPDAGGARRATDLANYLDVSFAIIHKERNKPNEVSNMILVGDVKGKTCIVVDDIMDTCGTIIKATECLLSSGAKRVFGVATHGILSGNAVEKVENSQLEKLVITNTIPQDFLKNGNYTKFEVIDVSNIFTQSIYCIHNRESMLQLRSILKPNQPSDTSVNEKSTQIDSEIE